MVNTSVNHLTLQQARQTYHLAKKMEWAKILHLFGIPVALKFGTSSDRNVARDVLFFETSKIKSIYDGWDSTLRETETGFS